MADIAQRSEVLQRPSCARPRFFVRFKNMKTTLIALTLNEVEGCKAVMPQINLARFDQVLILDGGSKDGTVEWCREQGYEVYIQKKKGIRHAYLEALPLIKGDIIVTISPDGNCPAEAVSEVLDKALEGYDLVIGSRYYAGAKSEDDGWVTGFGNWLFTRTVNLLHGGSYTDAMVIFRAFTKKLIYELDLHREDAYTLPEKLFSTVISWEPLMAVRAAKAKKRIADVAVGEPPRIGGVRKLQILRWGAAYYFQFWRELWFWTPAVQIEAAVEIAPENRVLET
jgi:glycosyltransferase involved in cell wall biosynthesis